MATRAKLYCNTSVAKGGSCSSGRVINGADFQRILGTSVSLSSCEEVESTACGSSNNLINIGGLYWYHENISGTRTFYGFATKSITAWNTNGRYGVRPVITLDPKVYIKSGSGTTSSPYVIAKHSY